MMKTVRLIFAMCCLHAMPTYAECAMSRVALLPITLWQDKLFIPVSINNTTEYFFVDTGAATTSLSSAMASALTLPRNFDHTADTFGVGGMESHLYIGEVEELSLGGLRYHGKQWPIADFGQRMADGAPIGGLIGADILSRFDIDIDIPNRRMGLWKVAGCSEVKPDWQGDAASVPMHVLESRHITVPVRINGASLDLLLDTGSPGLVLSTRAAARAGATPDVLEESRRLHGTGINDRAFNAWFHVFERLDVNGEIFGDVRGMVVANGRMFTDDGLLGLEFLKRSRVWLSYASETFFVRPGRS